MTVQTWWLYCVTVFLVSATPGPNMLHVMGRGVRFGAGRAAISAAGCLAAILIVLSASALGLGAILLAFPTLFEAIRYAGVAYLVWLGIKAWRAPVEPAADDETIAPRRRLSNTVLFRDGFLIAISNPKLIVFAAALFPQFIDDQSARLPQFAVLVATFVPIEGFWYGVYALGGHRLARYLSREGRQRIFNRLSGALFVGFGAALFGWRS